MDYRLPILAVALLAGVAGIARAVFGVDPPAPPRMEIARIGSVPAAVKAFEGQNSGAGLIHSVIRRLEESPPIAAKVRHRTRLFGQKLIGNGTYLQQNGPRGTLSRFSLSVRTDDQMVSLLHVCDGRYLWVRDSTARGRDVSRVDLRRVSEAAGEMGLDPNLHSMSLGAGLPRLIASLNANFDFAAPYSLTFQDVPVWAVACHWKPDRLSKLLPGRKGLFDARGHLRVEQLPDQMPDRVFLLVGRDDLFPYHIDFRRSSGEDATSSDKSSRATSRSLVTIELFEVQFGAEITPTAFVYRIGDIKIDDLTDEYLARTKSGF